MMQSRRVLAQRGTVVQSADYRVALLGGYHFGYEVLMDSAL
jgi:hypothetical protein